MEEPGDGAPETWRGQRYRPMSGKWANRGGRNRAYFDWKYGYGKSGFCVDAQKEQATRIAERVGLTVTDDTGGSSSRRQGGSSSSSSWWQGSEWWKSDKWGEDDAWWRSGGWWTDKQEDDE